VTLERLVRSAKGPSPLEHSWLAKGSRVVVVGRLQQRSWTAADGSARQVVEVVAEELGPSLRWATATPVRATRSASDSTVQERPVKGA
jgi:single-stranded DNA-binding protein